MSSEDEVRQAAARFYEALNEAFHNNTEPMAQQWSQTGQVTTMLPSGGRQIGRDEVRPTWEQLAPDASSSSGLNSASVSDLVVIPVSDDVAYTIGTEQLSGTANGQPISVSVRTTIIFHREDGQWRVVHRHGDALRR